MYLNEVTKRKGENPNKNMVPIFTTFNGIMILNTEE